MANVASPYGLRPVNLIGGQPFAGQFREYKVAANNTAAIYNGDLVVLAAGQPAAVAATPVAGTTFGIVGVCVGVRYVMPGTKQPMYAQFLPANAITGGYTDVFVRVVDDPDALFQVQGNSAFGTLGSGTNGSGWPAAVGRNSTLIYTTAGSTTTGNSGVSVNVGSNGAGLVTTVNLAVRVVDVVEGTESDLYPDLIVKLNHGIHSYYATTGV
jgi:hypothetical protein